MDKIIARKFALNDRRTYDNIERSKRITEEIISSNILEKYHNIGIYYPIGKEINIMS